MKISLIVPVLNEEEAIPLFHRAVRENVALSSHDVEIVFVNDGSSDGTEAVIRNLIREDRAILLCNLTRRFGKEAALMAGIEQATGDIIIPIDVDLQDPVDVIPLMLSEHAKGADVVLARRRERASDGFLKRITAGLFYRTINRLSETPIHKDVGDFRLLSRRAVEAIKSMPETRLFMKGIFSWIGYPTAVVEYSRPLRAVGSSKFNAWKLWNFALDGITSFSTAPLRVWTYVGFCIAAGAFFFGSWMILDKLLNGNPVPGYPSLMVSVLFLGGIQLIGIGVLGEYIGRMYIETKRRPRYLIKDAERAAEASE